MSQHAPTRHNITQHVMLPSDTRRDNRHAAHDGSATTTVLDDGTIYCLDAPMPQRARTPLSAAQALAAAHRSAQQPGTTLTVRGQLL